MKFLQHALKRQEEGAAMIDAFTTKVYVEEDLIAGYYSKNDLIYYGR